MLVCVFLKNAYISALDSFREKKSFFLFSWNWFGSQFGDWLTDTSVYSERSTVVWTLGSKAELSSRLWHEYTKLTVPKSRYWLYFIDIVLNWSRNMLKIRHRLAIGCCSIYAQWEYVWGNWKMYSIQSICLFRLWNFCWTSTWASFPFIFLFSMT